MKTPQRSLIASAVALVLVVGLAVASPASAAPGATIDSVEREGCTLSITITVEDAVEYELQIWDDGDELHSEAFTPAEAGETLVVTYTLVSDVNSDAPGIGIYVVDLATGSQLGYLDPYDFEGSDDIARACADSGGTDSGEETTTTAVDVTTTEVVATTVPAAPTASQNAPAAAAPTAAAPAAAPVAAAPTYTG